MHCHNIVVKWFAQRVEGVAASYANKLGDWLGTGGKQNALGTAAPQMQHTPAPPAVVTPVE